MSDPEYGHRIPGQYFRDTVTGAYSNDGAPIIPCRYERRARWCANGVRYLYGVDVDIETEKRWGSLIFMTKVLDTYLDEVNDDPVQDRIGKVIDFIHDREAVDRYFPLLSEYRVGRTTYAEMLRYGSEVTRMKRRVNAAKTEHAYIQNRRLEGRMYARLIGCLATDYVKEQPGYKRFGNTLVSIGEVANLFDSFTDIRGDVERGEIQLSPTAGLRARLLGSIAVSLVHSPATSRRNANRTSCS